MRAGDALEPTPQLDWLSDLARDLVARRDQAIARAQDHAEDGCPDWTRRASQFIGWYAREITHGQPFLIEDAVILVPRELKPKEPRAWGSAVRRAHRRGLIKHATLPDGTKRYAIGRNNLSPKPMWIAA